LEGIVVKYCIENRVGQVFWDKFYSIWVIYFETEGVLKIKLASQKLIIDALKSALAVIFQKSKLPSTTA
jgi:hypothetical protein